MAKAKTGAKRKDRVVMSDYLKQATEAGDQYLSALAESQAQFLKAVTAASAWVPKVPMAPAPVFAATLPTAREIVEANFAFAAKLLKQQKDFTEKLFATSAS
jgi:hypothetical protein